MDIKKDQFYLGRLSDDKPLLLKAKDLTTHALIVGMTGSGKTGLGIDILEEAGLNNIPALIIDPKGDMANLMLTFPELDKEEFAPWSEDPATDAKKWKEGLKKWGMDGKRIAEFRDSCTTAVYTPASDAGTPLSILSSFEPTKTDPDEAILSITSSLLGLLGIQGDPINSREHILISKIIGDNWDKNQPVDIDRLIQEVQNPPFAKIGALDVETFYPQKERMTLAITLNNLLASPRFQKWRQGVPLEIQDLLYTKNGKAKLSIFSLNHLSDSERMFFVTLLLNKLITWMRSQEGTSNLRALLYMDEIFGFFPPTATPPSKGPMLTLLKTARAYGLGVVLSTQNPADLDYKGLANCGIWFIGKLQTDRDRQRIMEGLKVASHEGFDEKLLSSLGNRRFLLHSVHAQNPEVFETRWTLSYLKGPLTLSQITTLVPKTENKIATEIKPNIPRGPEGVKALYIDNKNSILTPHLLVTAKLHYQQKDIIDIWEEEQYSYMASSDGKNILFESQEVIHQTPTDTPPINANYQDLPFCLQQKKNYELFKKSALDKIYQTQYYPIYTYKDLKLTSKSHEDKKEFLKRVAIALGEKRESQIDQLREKYRVKLDGIQKKMQAAFLKIKSQEEAQDSKTHETYISIGSTLLDAFLGKTRGALSKAGNILKKASKLGQKNPDSIRAQDTYNALTRELEKTQKELDDKIREIPLTLPSEEIPVETLRVRPTKRDLIIERLEILWK